MALALPNLDDRTFAQLLEEALQRIPVSCPEWTDFSVGNPEMALVDVLAYLTETMIYRLNRLPEKAYVAFLRLLGVTLLPPEPATVQLQFRLSRTADKPVEIPRGTRVSVSRAESGSEPPLFVVPGAVVIPAGKNEAEALAYHCE